jgi:hypothetical protein
MSHGMHLEYYPTILQVRKAFRFDSCIALPHDCNDALVGMGPHVRVFKPLSVEGLIGVSSSSSSSSTSAGTSASPAARIAGLGAGILVL